jgi:hypothetical protein
VFTTFSFAVLALLFSAMTGTTAMASANRLDKYFFDFNIDGVSS